MKKKFLFILFLLVFLSGSLFTYLKAQEEKPLLHFVQISDTHLQSMIAPDGERLLKSSEELLTTLVNQINEIKDLDFVLSTGDNVDQTKEELVNKYIEVTMSLKYPLHVLFGNHDVGVNVALNKKEYIKKFAGSTSFTKDMSYYSFSPNEKFTFICLDGTTEKIITANGQIEEEEQWKWLKEELEQNKDKFIIIAQHFPLIEPFKSKSHFFLEPDRTKLLELVNSYKNVIGVFTGHYHAARLFKIENRIHNSNPAIIQHPCAFREITITQEKPKYLLVDFKWHEVKKPELREKSKANSKSWRVSEGAVEDREQVIKWKIYK